jgi:hypothetical protein
MRHLLAGLISISIVALAQPAHAHGGVHFMGPHPIAAKMGGGYCYIDAPHIHVYAPDHPQLYQRAGDNYVFTADPTPFGYDGEKHPFYGHHPVAMIGSEPVLCFLDGPHFHAFAAPVGPDYRMERGVAFYVGAMPPQYAKWRPSRERVINAAYRPYVAMRPTIEVTPPPEWHGEVWVAPPAIEVGAPGIAVAAPGIEVAAPGVVVAPPSVVVRPPHVHVAAPSFSFSAPGVAVSAPGVVVGAPGVVVGAPGVAVSGGVYVEGGREHHDNGRHRGWGRHDR